jgi:AcrR family transcriptional regulator
MAPRTGRKTKEATGDAEPRRSRGRPQLRSDEETRAIIFDAARHEFAASGFATSSMDSVARRAGISTKTLYRLVPNKAALFEAMVTDRLDQFASAVRLRACEGRDIEAALQEALLVCADLLLNGEVIALQRMVLAESDKFPEIARTFYTKAMRRTVATLANWLRVEKERGLIAIEDDEVAAGMLLGMLAFEPQRTVMLGQKPPPGGQELARRVAVCASLFLDGARAKAPGPRHPGRGAGPNPRGCTN